MSASCEWINDQDDSSTYDTQCGHSLMLIAGDPGENNYRYCPYCGNEITVFVVHPDEQAQSEGE